MSREMEIQSLERTILMWKRLEKVDLKKHYPDEAIQTSFSITSLKCDIFKSMVEDGLFEAWQKPLNCCFLCETTLLEANKRCLKATCDACALGGLSGYGYASCVSPDHPYNRLLNECFAGISNERYRLLVGEIITMCERRLKCLQIN